MNQQAADLFVNARTELLLREPFFGQLALYLRPTQDPARKVRAVATDGRHIFYNPDWVNSLQPGLLRTSIAVCVLRTLLQHVTRRNGRDPFIWGIASSAVVNKMLKDAGFKMHKDSFLIPGLGDKSVEQVYERLKENSEEIPPEELETMLPPPPDMDIEETEQEWKAAAVSAANSVTSQGGSVPGPMQRFISELVDPKVPWREVLRRFITQLNQDDYSFARPNKKFLAHGMFMPGLFGEGMGPVAVAIDTSGSIDQATLDAFAAEIRAIASNVRPSNVKVIYCDAEVNHVDEFGPGEEMTFKLHGGGGTDFRPPFTLLEKDDVPPEAFIYLTDMMGAFPANPPSFPTLWCATTDRVGPFGETIQLEV